MSRRNVNYKMYREDIDIIMKEIRKLMNRVTELELMHK